MQPIAKWADGMETAGRSSGNATLEDFAVAAALYLRTYASLAIATHATIVGSASYRFGSTTSYLEDAKPRLGEGIRTPTGPSGIARGGSLRSAGPGLEKSHASDSRR
jgi:hypothetical protein